MSQVKTPIAKSWRVTCGKSCQRATRGRHESKDNGNAIDSRFDSSLTDTPGTCVFLPNGENGRVVAIKAVQVSPSGETAPVETFCVYRYRQDDPWTAIEPIVGGIELANCQSVIMAVSIRTFDSLDAYRAAGG